MGGDCIALIHCAPYCGGKQKREPNETKKGTKVELLQNACVISGSSCTVLKERIQKIIKEILRAHLVSNEDTPVRIALH